MDFLRETGVARLVISPPHTGLGGNPRISPLTSRLHDQVEKFFRLLRIIAPQLLERFQGGAAVT
jgi:hypothetical protein